MILNRFLRRSNVLGAPKLCGGRTPPSSRLLLNSTTTRYFSGSSSTHNDTDYNNQSTPFDFTRENMEKAKKIVAKYPVKASAIMPLLDLAQRQNNNWLPLAAMNKVAKILEVSPMQVYEVASFYTMYNREPVGKFFVQMCTTTPCMVAAPGAYAVLDEVLKACQVSHAGDTSEDNLFTVIEVECLGACANAPMMQINDDYYENLTPTTAKAVIDALRAGKQPKAGPQNGKQRAAEGPMGKTTLKGDEVVGAVVCEAFAKAE